MLEPIANEKIYGIRSSGERIVIEIEIGKPYLREEKDSQDWVCPISLKPLYPRLSDALGVDSLHALCLAISLILDLMTGFCDEGGRLEYEDGTEFSFEAYAFGKALRI